MPRSRLKDCRAAGWPRSSARQESSRCCARWSTQPWRAASGWPTSMRRGRWLRAIGLTWKPPISGSCGHRRRPMRHGAPMCCCAAPPSGSWCWTPHRPSRARWPCASRDSRANPTPRSWWWAREAGVSPRIPRSSAARCDCAW